MRFRVSRPTPSAKSIATHKRNVKDGANPGDVKHVKSITGVSPS